MSVPREDYVLRLRWTNPVVLTSNILDLLAVSEDETVALVAWEAHADADFVQAGFAVIRFTNGGKIHWQSTHTFCGPVAGANCGQWVLRYGAIAVDGDRYVVIGTIVDAANPNLFESVGVGINEGGAVAWSRRYQTTFSIGRAMGIVRLTKAGRFLVASHNANETETWLYGLDRNGALTGLEMRFFGKFVQRLRALPTQGIFVLGTNIDDSSHPLGWIVNVDPATGTRVWERTYDPYDGTTLRWCDAAEGRDIVTVIGNTGATGQPFVATLENNGAADPGNVKASFRPGSDDPIVLNGIANHLSPVSTSSICGQLDGTAWHLAIDDSVTILWQKKYTHGRSNGSLTPTLFPNADTVVAGGQAIVPGDPPRGLLVQSKAVIGSPASLTCGVETEIAFEPADLTSAQIDSPFKPLAMTATPWFVNQTPLLEIDEGCLP